MPGHDHKAGERIERDWEKRGYEDARAGKPASGPDEYWSRTAAGIGLDTAGAYRRGYDRGRACQVCGNPSGACEVPGACL